jgi:hypothetical protein
MRPARRQATTFSSCRSVSFVEERYRNPGLLEATGECHADPRRTSDHHPPLDASVEPEQDEHVVELARVHREVDQIAGPDLIVAEGHPPPAITADGDHQHRRGGEKQPQM